MGRWVLDTNVLIDATRGDPRALGLLDFLRQADEEIWSVTPVRTELWAGQRPGEIAIIHDLIDSISWLSVDGELADAAGRMAAVFRRNKPDIEFVDFLIAAATRKLGADLLTLNVKDFPMFLDLEAAYT
ncbi:MAG: PIN domain-containing protein [Candidatus Limnocylindrales bacterium]